MEDKERQLILQLCSKNPSPEEVQWYTKQMEMLGSDSEEETSVAMDNIIAGYKKITKS